MADEKKQLGRVAMRVEGNQWVAYYALSDTMEGALRLGQVALVVVADEERKIAFMEIFRSFAAEAIGHAEAVWLTQRAPESERPGNG